MQQNEPFPHDIHAPTNPSAEDLLLVKTLQQRKIVKGLLIAILILFFFPFFSISCKGISVITVDGIDLVTGKSIDDDYDFDDAGIPPSPWAILALICPALALGSYFSNWVQKDGGSLVLIMVGTACIIALAVVIKVKGASKLDLDNDYLEVKIKLGMGLVLAIASYLGATYFSYNIYRSQQEIDSRPTNAPGNHV